ncbi:hypothetical protein ACIRP0_28200 [Streptomyces sp. NPDC101733]|uniref:hypothetical protein n=1 Tax=unclassified Streptomyces TaxID=2593676 RepID=UPI0038134AF6
MLTALAAALIAAFVVAPRTLAARSDAGYADQGGLVRALREAFVGYWGAGERGLSPGMRTVVDYWFRYHVAKGVIAAVLLAVLVALGVHLWKAFLRAEGLGAGTRTALASAGVLVPVLALCSSAVVLANVQGALAPLSSLVSMLPVDETDGPLAGALDQVRQGLGASPPAGGRTLPALDAMIGDFAHYHVVMAVSATIVALVLVCLSVLSWKARAGTDPSDGRARRVWRAFGVASALSALLLFVVAAANTTTAADPAPALLAFFDSAPL